MLDVDIRHLQHYATLELQNKRSSQKDIKDSYRRLSIKHHPDRSKESNANERSQAINEAYSVLSDPRRKDMYDAFGGLGLARLEEMKSTLPPKAKEAADAVTPVGVWLLASFFILVVTCSLLCIMLVLMKVDHWIAISWRATLAPFWLLLLCFVLALLNLAKSPQMQMQVLLGMGQLGIPMIGCLSLFLVLLSDKLDQRNNFSWFAVFTPLFVYYGLALAGTLDQSGYETFLIERDTKVTLHSNYYFWLVMKLASPVLKCTLLICLYGKIDNEMLFSWWLIMSPLFFKHLLSILICAVVLLLSPPPEDANEKSNIAQLRNGMYKEFLDAGILLFVTLKITHPTKVPIALFLVPIVALILLGFFGLPFVAVLLDVLFGTFPHDTEAKSTKAERPSIDRPLPDFMNPELTHRQITLQRDTVDNPMMVPTDTLVEVALQGLETAQEVLVDVAIEAPVETQPTTQQLPPEVAASQAQAHEETPLLSQPTEQENTVSV